MSTEELLARLQFETATTAICWTIEKRDGTFIRGTEHDRDITIGSVSPSDDLSGTYSSYSSITGSNVKSSSDMSVDNMEVQGSASDTVIDDISVADIEAGLFDRAIVTVFLVDWENPNIGYKIIKRGYLGEIKYDSDNRYSTEIRGITQLLSQVVTQNYSERCNVKRLGDSRCKVNVAALTITATVVTEVNRKRFVVSGITSQEEEYFAFGTLTGITGANAGYEREIKRDSYDDTQGYIELFNGFPNEVEVGDTFSMEPGCDRLPSTCRTKFNNIENIRAYGLYIPGALALLKGPT